jgi:DNA-binding transcriptional regulator YiaG
MMTKHGNAIFPGEQVRVMREGTKVASTELARVFDVNAEQVTIKWPDGRQEQVPIDQIVQTTND